ncbi:MAG TPA: hypothetical protein VF492_11995 [Verrucomicrobiae bacterium]
MNAVPADKLKDDHQRLKPAASPGHRAKVFALAVVVICLMLWASPPTALSVRALRAVGWRTVVTGLTLWLFVSVASMLAILFLKLTT